MIPFIHNSTECKIIYRYSKQMCKCEHGEGTVKKGGREELQENFGGVMDRLFFKQ